MTNDEQLAKKEAKRRARRRSNRMAFVTVAVAAFYFCGTDYILNGGDRWHLQHDGIRYINKVRATAMILFPLPSAAEGQAPNQGLFSAFGLPPRPGSQPAGSSEQQEANARNLRHIAAVAGAADLWERVMWGLCLLMMAVALISWITPWGRFFHLIAALAIILVTFFSLACLHYLEVYDVPGAAFWPLSPETYAALTTKWKIPKGGGFGPLPDAPRTYLALSALLSTYGWVLVGVFARRIRPDSMSPPDPRGED